MIKMGAFFQLLAWGLLLPLVAALPDEVVVKRVQAHLLIQDPVSACAEARTGFKNNPQSPLLFEAYIKALAKQGNEKELWQVWNARCQDFPETCKKREVLESIAWGIIENGARSASPVVRIMALLGAFFGQDARGVQILCQNMRDPNAQIRCAALRLAGNMRDVKLQDAVLQAYDTDADWKVRLEALEAMGEMEIPTAKPRLLKVLSDPHVTAEERALAIAAWIQLLEDAERVEVEKLARSSRSGLRQLACEVVLALDLERDADLMVELLGDHHSAVRAAALRTLGILRVKSFNDIPLSTLAKPYLQDNDPLVAMTAAQVIALQEPEVGQKALAEWLNNPSQEIRLQAAGALVAAGKYGLPLVKEVFYTTSDPYVRMNLALGLISQRKECEQACNALFEGLKNQSERWDWEETGGFRLLVPSQARHDDAIPNHPEVLNQLTRLEILNILAMLKYPKTQEAIRSFLKEKNWGVTGMAAALLLTEGDESAVDIVHALLKDPNPKVRIQAALILAQWGKGEDAIGLLEQAYPAADRELKEKIIEGLGNIGALSSIPFLTLKLQEPYQSLRIIAAAALLVCLYN